MARELKYADKATQQMLKIAEAENIPTIWDRWDAMQPQCGFGTLGLCCRHCLQGPCRIDPFGEGATQGACGATADTIVARNLVRAIAAGCAAHSGHAKHLAHTLLKSAQGLAPDYPIRDEGKLRALAARLGLATDGLDVAEIARQVAEVALADFSEKETPVAWAATNVTQGRVETFVKLDVVPTGIDASISEIMHRTHYGVDADPVNLLLGGVKCALADFAGCAMGSDLADVLFGTPQPVVSRANLGVLNPEAVNIGLHGHSPILSDLIAQVAHDLLHAVPGDAAAHPAEARVDRDDIEFPCRRQRQW